MINYSNNGLECIQHAHAHIQWKEPWLTLVRLSQQNNVLLYPLINSPSKLVSCLLMVLVHGESTLNKTIGNSTLHDYETCIRVGTDPICFSAVIFHRGVEIARTVRQELILLQCNTNNISSVYNNGVTVTNSITMEVVPQGTKVLHNTVLSFQCTTLCKLIGTNTTRCVNGTFESLLNESSNCKFYNDATRSRAL